MKVTILLAALLLAVTAGGAHALTLQPAEGGSGGAALLTDPDEALQKKVDESGKISRFSSGSTSSGSGFSFGFSGRSDQDRQGSTFDRMMPWADQQRSAPSVTGGVWR